MKKVLSALLALVLTASLVVPALAAAPDAQTAEEAIKALGILTPDANGNMNLSKTVTRAEFSKMLISASTYKDTIAGGSGTSPYRDVKYTHWAADYIKTVVDLGLMTGYVDGTFRPDSPVLLEDAANALLKLLGYSAADLSGTYPQAQISKFKSLKLSDGVSLAQGQSLTRRDCMLVFYNLMGAQTKEGKVYGQTLGYTVSASGEIDYAALILGDAKGPFIGGDFGIQGLPFALDTATVYRNGNLSTGAAVAKYDVYYYNANTKTVWVYSNRAVGVLSAVAPDAVSPTSATVAGVEYGISTSAAAHKLSSAGEYKVGDSVALLLGMNGEVIDVLPAKAVDADYYGVVLSSGSETMSGGTGNSTTDFFLTVACTDGVTRKFPTTLTTLKTGALVSVRYTGGTPTVKRLSIRGLSGTVSRTGKTLGDYTFAETVEILDVTETGECKVLYPARLAGVKLEKADIKYYLLNENGEISHLIRNDATGDAHTYGYLTNVQTNPTAHTGTYQYIIDGKAGTFSGGIFSNVDGAGALFLYKNGAVSMIKSLSKVTLSSVGSMTATGGERQYPISEDVQVYLRSGSSYTLTELAAISDTSKYTVTGYYDDGLFTAGGQIRLIVATAR
ncbi:S-layer homology domain-containing protein [Oscillospiraceae bacterium OttesenSCG-928-G22]|nr:S-layer homology domain-containing protein [Oscillospiraceae bacterium OttesenSCG-928-G22]